MTAAERSGHVRRLTRALGRATTPEAARSLRWQRALWAGHVGEVLDLLGDAHPDSVRLGPAGDALIHHAIGVTSPEVLRALIGRGADVDYGAGDGFPALLNAIVHEADPARRLAVVGLLLDAGADVQRRGVNHWTPLHAAALTGDARLVRLLLDAGADPEARTVIDDDATAAEEADRLGVPAGAATIRAWLAERR